jgi:DHA1 family inner membrane transport protein
MLTSDLMSKQHTALSTLSMTALTVTSPLFFLILPLYVSALGEHVGLSNEQIGTLVSIELSGAVLTSLLGVVWIRRVRWDWMAAVTMLLLATANVVSIYCVHELALLTAARAVAGVAAGAGASLAFTALGDTDSPGRSFGIAVTGQLIVAGVLLAVLPAFIARQGMAALFLIFAATACLSITSLRWFPRGVREPRSVATVHGGGRGGLRPLWGLTGTGCIFLGQTAVWAFTDRIGVANGLSHAFIGSALGLAHIPAVAGSLLAVVTSGRVSRAGIMGFCAIGEIVAALVLLSDFGKGTFLAATCLFQFCWTLWVPLQMASVAESDQDKRFTVLLTAFQAAGVSVGPALAAHLIHGASFVPVVAVGAVFAAIGLLLFMPLVYRRRYALLPGPAG